MRKASFLAASLGFMASVVLAQTPPPAYVPSQRQYNSYPNSPNISNAVPEVPVTSAQFRTHDLINRWKASAEPSERAKTETSLRDLLKREFVERLSTHEREIKELEAKVRQLREQLARRREKQDEIVEHRLQQILREAQGLGWGSEGLDAQTNVPGTWPATPSPFWTRTRPHTSALNAVPGEESVPADPVASEPETPPSEN